MGITSGLFFPFSLTRPYGGVLDVLERFRGLGRKSRRSELKMLASYSGTFRPANSVDSHALFEDQA